MISRVGVSVGMSVGSGVFVGVADGAVGVARLKLRETRLSTSAFSPIRVNRNVMIPFGTLDRSHK